MASSCRSSSWSSSLKAKTRGNPYLSSVGSITSTPRLASWPSAWRVSHEGRQQGGAQLPSDVYYTTYSCRLVLGIQARSFVGQKQFSLKWMTKGLSIRGRHRLKMVSLKQPCNQIQEISCVPNTPKTMPNCIGALVRRRDGDTSVVWIVDISFYNLKIKNSKVTSSKMEHKRYCNA
jgi:hypothetical protein